MRRWPVVALLLGSCLPPGEGRAADAAPGSWLATAPALSVARSDRMSCAQALVPPPLARGRALAALRWRFSMPPAAPLQAWLCHPQQCVALSASHGQTRALAGQDAGQPLQLCFRLAAPGAALRVGDLQVLVDYR